MAYRDGTDVVEYEGEAPKRARGRPPGKHGRASHRLDLKFTPHDMQIVRELGKRWGKRLAPAFKDRIVFSRQGGSEPRPNEAPESQVVRWALEMAHALEHGRPPDDIPPGLLSAAALECFQLAHRENPHEAPEQGPEASTPEPLPSARHRAPEPTQPTAPAARPVVSTVPVTPPVPVEVATTPSVPTPPKKTKQTKEPKVPITKATPVVDPTWAARLTEVESQTQIDREAQRAAFTKCDQLVTFAARVTKTRAAYVEAINAYNSEAPHFRFQGVTAVRRARNQHADAVVAANTFRWENFSVYGEPLPEVPDVFPDASALPLPSSPLRPILKSWLKQFCPAHQLQGIGLDDL